MSDFIVIQLFKALNSL